MILNTAARAAYAKAIALDTAIDARVIRADGSVTATTAATFEGLKDASERAWAEYREAKDAQVAEELPEKCDGCCWIDACQPAGSDPDCREYLFTNRFWEEPQ